MKKEDYLKSIVIDDTLVNIGIDDYGQCYYFEYYDTKERQIKEVSCGTYCTNYEQEIKDYFTIKAFDDYEDYKHNINL